MNYETNIGQVHLNVIKCSLPTKAGEKWGVALNQAGQFKLNVIRKTILFLGTGEIFHRRNVISGIVVEKEKF